MNPEIKYNKMGKFYIIYLILYYAFTMNKSIIKTTIKFCIIKIYVYFLDLFDHGNFFKIAFTKVTWKIYFVEYTL